MGVCPLFLFGGHESGPRVVEEMGASDVVDQVRTVASRVAASYGLEIFDVSFRREGPGMVLRIRITGPGRRRAQRKASAWRTARTSAAI